MSMMNDIASSSWLQLFSCNDFDRVQRAGRRLMEIELKFLLSAAAERRRSDTISIVKATLAIEPEATDI